MKGLYDDEKNPRGGQYSLASASPHDSAGMQVCAHKLHPVLAYAFAMLLMVVAALVFSPKTVLAADLTSYAGATDFQIYNEQGDNSATNPIKTYSQFGMRLTIGIDTGATVQIHNGDTVTLDLPKLPSEFTTYGINSATSWSELKGTAGGVEKVVGQWRVTANRKVEIKFNANADGFSVISALNLNTGVIFKANVVKYTQNQVKSGKATMGDVQKDTYFKGNTLDIDTGYEFKKWASAKTNKMVEWGLGVNTDALNKLYSGTYTGSELEKNVYVEDNLGDKTVTRLSPRLNIPFPTSLEDPHASRSGLIKAFPNAFTKVTPDYTAYPTYDSFKASLQPMQWGVYKDGSNNRFVANVGSFDSTGTKYSTVWPTYAEDAADAAIAQGFYQASDRDKLIALFKKTFGEANAIQGSIPSWLLYISVNYPVALKDTPVTNDATMTHDGKTETATGKTTLNGLIGDVKLAAFEAELIKVGPKGEALQGAKITLQKQDSGSWTDFRSGTTSETGQVKFTKLPAGKYRFVETEAPTGYDKDDLTFTDKDGNALASGEFEVKADDTEGHILIAKNGASKETTEVGVTKAWVGPKVASVTVHLLADGVDTGKTLTLNEANHWTGTFTNLFKYDQTDTHEITYTVKEDAVPNYDSATTGDAAGGFTITNTNTEKVSVPVEKKWDDGDNQDGKRPSSVTVHLLADGVDTGKTVTLNQANSWKDGFADLPKYKDDGTEIVYTVKEDAVEGYTSTTADVAGTKTITNKYTPATAEVKVTKAWVGPKAASVTVHLLADGTDTGKTLTLNEANHWTGTFADLAKYKNGGTEIAYTVKEDAVPNYNSETTGDAATGFTVTNTNTEKVTVPVEKKWVGPTASSVTVHLLADGTDTGKTLTLDAAGNWVGSFADLAKYNADGAEIAYTVKEDALPNYNSQTTGDAAGGFTITNVNTEKVTVPVEKKWDDADNQDGKRPVSVTVHLLADGVDTGQMLTLDVTNSWKDTFANLPKYTPLGAEITYTVSEDAVDGYTFAIAGDAATGLTVTNTHTPATTEVKVTKTWVGKKGSSVTVHLLADGVDTGKTLTLDAAGNWTGSFTDLPKYKDGAEIAYTVKEDAVEGYTSEVTGDAATGFTVTNTEVPPTTPETPGNPETPEPKKPSKKKVPYMGDAGILPAATTLAMGVVSAGSAYVVRRHSKRDKQ